MTRAIHKIHNCYHERLDVEALAGSADERAQLSSALSHGHRHLAHAVPQVDAPASGADAAQRPDGGEDGISGRL
uniref:Uncharacterized protein n=1 Tax=Ectopseudomonas oleovorans TaxID=301 RepID=A0A653BEI1_ECTOL